MLLLVNLSMNDVVLFLVGVFVELVVVFILCKKKLKKDGEFVENLIVDLVD